MKSIRLLEATSDPNLNCQKFSQLNVVLEPWPQGPQQGEGSEAAGFQYLPRGVNSKHTELGLEV
jgi:hypothetical protein